MPVIGKEKKMKPIPNLVIETATPLEIEKSNVLK
jgi:hypothetical protein